jgi:pyruvate dehydrogenase E2 component (dihydrolipoamide acetyltransferase)
VTELAYRLPDVGEGLQEAEILAWRVAEGDRVRADDILAEVETDKSVVEIPAPHDGLVVRLGGAVGDVVPVGGVLAVLDVDDEPVAPVVPVDQPVAPSAPTPAGNGRVRASPATRRRATELGVALADVPATGPAGRVLLTDVERAAAGSRPQTGGDEEQTVEPLRGVRRRIAQTMAQTLQIPAITEWRDIDATELLAVHARLRERLAARGVRLTLLPIVLKGAAAALREHPRFNARIDVDGEEITYLHRVHLGVATATEDGLLVPVIHDVDRLSLVELAGELARLGEAARARSLAVGDSAGGTFTVTNFGSFGTIRGAPLIRPPEVAIAGIGRVHDAVVPIDGRAEIRPILPLVVSTDHRLNDGDHLAAFCETLAAYLADPALLLV